MVKTVEPLARFRWVEREVPAGPVNIYRIEKVLQQALRDVSNGRIEWTDVPTEKEGAEQ